MQTIVTYDWPGSVGNEVVSPTSSRPDHWAGFPVSRVYAKQMHKLFNYGMNACDDPVLVKHCIVQCFVEHELLPHRDEGVINIFKVFRRLLTQQVGTNFFSDKNGNDARAYNSSAGGATSEVSIWASVSRRRGDYALTNRTIARRDLESYSHFAWRKMR